MNRLLYPDKSTALYSIYHRGASFLIPGIFVNIVANRKMQEYPYIGIITVPSICQMAFHSHFSMVNVVQDYIKHVRIQHMLRGASLTGHGIAAIGFIYSALNPLKKDM